MNKIILLLLTLIFFYNLNAQQDNQGTNNKVTFKLKITEIENPDSVGIVWLILPYVEGKTVEQVSYFPKVLDANGFYHQTITFADSLVGKSIAYLYVAKDKYDFWRNFVVKKNQDLDRIESWGFVDGLEGRMRPTVMLFPEPNSTEETTLFIKPYVGVTTDGKPTENLFPIKKTGVSTAPIKNAVIAFLESLNADQKVTCTFPIESEEWRRWHNIERWKRAGVCLEDLNTKQKDLAFAFLKESLSAKGLKKATDIMTMEAYLATLVPDNKFLGGEKYWFTFYGTPSDTEPWGWQIEGHHLVINYFILGDQVVMTPTFMGSEPTLIDSGENKGLRTFAAEENKGLNFYLSLDSLQKKEATIWNKKDFDFNRSEAFRDNEIIANTGISASKLSKTQQVALLDLIEEYVNNVRDGQAKVKMTDVKLHLNETNFTWVQGENIESPFYYRIHSPVILIEFDHQSPVFLYDKSKPYPGPVKTHIHTVVRTPNGNDYGKDLLKEHLKKHHNHKKE
ncbi:MAG TPA: DUF3500 domain-containing protein [Saprospiraceae bacterium]|nr:DUF3500 domain-containing protein [Saprospiraceae bacterium]